MAKESPTAIQQGTCSDGYNGWRFKGSLEHLKSIIFNKVCYDIEHEVNLANEKKV